MTRSRSERPTRAPARDGLFRAIELLLFADVVLGLALAVIGSAVLEVESITYAGLGLAAIGLALMIFFFVLARREAERLGKRRDG